MTGCFVGVRLSSRDARLLEAGVDAESKMFQPARVSEWTREMRTDENQVMKQDLRTEKD